MQCPKCKKEIKNDSIFCEYCGTRIKPEVQTTIQSSKFWKWSSILTFVALIILLMYKVDSSSDSNNDKELRNEIHRKSNEISSLKSQIQNYKTRVTDLESEMETMRRNSNSTPPNNEAYYVQQINTLNAKINQLNTTISQKNSTIKNRDNSIKKLQDEIAALRSLL